MRCGRYVCNRAKVQKKIEISNEKLVIFILNDVFLSIECLSCKAFCLLKKLERATTNF